MGGATGAAAATGRGVRPPIYPGRPGLADRTWVLLTEAPEGGWGLNGQAHTNADLVAAARAEIARLAGS